MDAAGGGAHGVASAPAILSIGTILGCLCVPLLAERFGRSRTLALYFLGMFVRDRSEFRLGVLSAAERAGAVHRDRCSCSVSSAAISPCSACGCPSNIGTDVRATAFAFCTSIGRFIGAGVNFVLAGAVLRAWARWARRWRSPRSHS